MNSNININEKMINKIEEDYQYLIQDSGNKDIINRQYGFEVNFNCY